MKLLVLSQICAFWSLFGIIVYLLYILAVFCCERHFCENQILEIFSYSILGQNLRTSPGFGELDRSRHKWSAYVLSPPWPLASVLIGLHNPVLRSDWPTDVEARLRSVTRHLQPLGSFDLQTYIAQRDDWHCSETKDFVGRAFSAIFYPIWVNSSVMGSKRDLEGTRIEFKSGKNGWGCKPENEEVLSW